MRGQEAVLICTLFFLTLASTAGSFSSERQESCPTEKGMPAESLGLLGKGERIQSRM